MEEMGIYLSRRPQLVERYPLQFQKYDDLTNLIDSNRQKLIAVELQSINTYSSLLNQNTEKLDGSIKTLDKTVHKLMRSSRTIEYFTVAVIFVAIASLAIALLPVNSTIAAIIAGADVASLFALFYRLLRDKTLRVE